MGFPYQPDGNTPPPRRPPTTTSGGGQVGTPSGGTGGGIVADTGGVNANSLYFLIPLYDYVAQANSLYILDTTNFNPNVVCSYTFRSEDIEPNRVPTVRRVILIYRDLGQVTVTVSLEASNDSGQIVSNSVTKTLGNTTPTNKLLTAFVDIVLTGFRPQLTISRAAGAGPLSLVSVTMTGEVEDQTL